MSDNLLAWRDTESGIRNASAASIVVLKLSIASLLGTA